MSHKAVAGRSGRQTYPNSKYGAADDGVTVKTLPSSGSSSQHGPKKLYSSKDEQTKYRKDTYHDTSRVPLSRNGELTPTSRAKFSSSGTTNSSSSGTSNSSSNSSHNSNTAGNNSNSAHVATSSKSTLADGDTTSGNSGKEKDSDGGGNAMSGTSKSFSTKPSSSVDRKKNYGYDGNPEVEVRTHSNNYRNNSRTVPTRPKPDRSHHASSLSAPASTVSQTSRLTSRAFTSEKYRNTTEGRGMGIFGYTIL